MSRMYNALAISISLFTATASASPQHFTTARALGMGGTGVAVAHPATANSANPAMLAAGHHEKADNFGLIIPSINVRVADEEDVVDQIDRIQDTIDLAEQRANSLDGPGTRAAIGELREQLQKFDRDTARVDVGAGLSLAFPSQTRLAVGVYTNASIRATVRSEYDPADDALLASLEQSSDAALITYFQTNNLEDELLSRGRVLASAVGEVGLALGRTFELPNYQPLQVGLTTKYQELRTFQYTERVGAFDDDDYDRFETTKSSLNFDLGVAYRFGDHQQWNLGAVVRNLIPVKLDSAASDLTEEVHTLRVDPHLVMGVARLGTYYTLTAELDLTKKKAFGFEDDTQWLALGAEFDAFRHAQLRGGIRHNLASNSDNDGIEESTQLTVGLGLSIFGARLDLGALFSDADIGGAIELGAAF